MPDLIRFRDSWFCSLRESDLHAYGKPGHIRILTSQDGVSWMPCALLEEEGIDLRDPKLSITPHGLLMLIVGGTLYDNKRTYLSLRSRVSFSSDGKNWSPFQHVVSPHEWLWRVTWHLGKAYGAAYSRSDPKDKYKEWHIRLYESDDGVNFKEMVQWSIPGYPNETTLRFLKSGEMVALVRRDGRTDNNAWIGSSQPPYKEWKWHETPLYFGGPNFLLDSEQNFWAGGRILMNMPYGQMERTVLAEMDHQSIRPCLILPSGGDCSYPGLYLFENVLWMNYYSSHEGKAAIYLARIDLM